MLFLPLISVPPSHVLADVAPRPPSNTTVINHEFKGKGKVRRQIGTQREGKVKERHDDEREREKLTKAEKCKRERKMREYHEWKQKEETMARRQRGTRYKEERESTEESMREQGKGYEGKEAVRIIRGREERKI